MKDISTLVPDIYKVLEERGGWTKVVNQKFMEAMGAAMTSRLTGSEQPRGTLRMSSIGQPCRRKLWYSVNASGEEERLAPSTLFKFMFGDILEEVLLSLAMAAGHTVEGQQDTMTLHGIKGHRDAVIDGVTVDVKSAASFSFSKFKDHKLQEDDPFGYLGQMTSYVKAAKDDPIVTDKRGGAFLVVDKQHGHICLDYYDLEGLGLLDGVDDMYEERITLSSQEEPPERDFEPVEDGKSGNMKLPTHCSYCGYKKLCHPDLRTFLYSTGPRFLTEVAKRPQAHIREVP